MNALQNFRNKLHYSHIFKSDVPCILCPAGKASDPDHSWTEQIEHTIRKLSTYYIVMYVKFNLTSQMWFIIPALAVIPK